MGLENGDPHDELASLFRQIDAAKELGELKPVYFQLNEIVQRHPDDFDVQLAASEIKERLLARGRALKRQSEETIAPVAAPVPPAPRQPAPPADPSSFEAPPTAREAPTISLVAPPAKPKAIVPVVVLMVAAAVLVVAVLAVVAFKIRKRDRVAPATAVATAPLEVATNPPGASVHVTGGKNEVTCTSDCKLTLAAGNYQVTALRDGFEPATGAIQVGVRPAAIRLTLKPQAQTVRLLTDLNQGKVTVDDQPPVDLQDGQLVLDKVPAGSHTVRFTGKDREASFTFEIADARLPVVDGPVHARNLVAVLVTSFGQQARLVTNAGPWKLAVNGQAQGDAGPTGTDLTNFKAGVDEIVVGEGKDQHNIIETFPALPMLTVFLKSDINSGTLIVSTGQDDVRVFLNGKEYRGRTKRGQVRIPAIGKVAVRVAKTGFQDEPAQNVEVKRGDEVRVAFDLKPQPEFGSLDIHGATAGAEVWLDQRIAGSVGPDGSFTLGGVPPGDRMIELRRDQYLPKKLPRSFRAGQTVALAGADVVLAPATGTVRFVHNVPVSITYRRSSESESHEVRGDQVELPVGTYSMAASAPGYAEVAITVKLGAGDSREVDFKLAPVRVAPPPPPPAGMTDFEDAATWRKDGDVWVRKGGGFSLFKPPPKGVFTFTVELLKGGGIFRPGQIRWFVQYLDGRNYLLFEMDRKNFWAGVVQKGKRYERSKLTHGLERQKSFTIQVEVTPDNLVTRVRTGDEWKLFDTFSEPGRDFTQGKFGFLIQGNDEIAISDFKFLPR